MSFRDFFRARFQVPAAKHQGGFSMLMFFCVYDDPVDKGSFCCDLGCIFGEDVHTKACVWDELAFSWQPSRARNAIFKDTFWGMCLLLEPL